MPRPTAATPAVLALLALPGAAPAAVLETITVPADTLTVTEGKVTLQEGKTYTLKAGGTFDQVGPEGAGSTTDALFCVASINQGGSTCSDHHRANDFQVTVGATTFKDVDAFGGPVQTYSAGHVYTVSFTAPATGVLRAGMYLARTNCTSCTTRASGSITVELSAASSSSPGPFVSRQRPSCQRSVRATIAGGGPSFCDFGLIAVLEAVNEAAAYDTGSAPLPPKAKAVELVGDVQNPEDEKLFEEFVVAVIRARRARLQDQLGGCLLMGGVTGLGALQTPRGRITQHACMKILVELHESEQARGRAAASGCKAHFVPFFPKGAKPSAGAKRRATARLKAGLRASCSRPHGTQIHMKLSGHGGSLNGVLGPRANTALGAFSPAGTTFGDGSRVAYSWGVASG